MDVTNQTNEQQAMLWKGLGGSAWVELQELLDGMFKPLEDLLVEGVTQGSGGRVLDVGCGAGATTLAVARRLGANGRCTGIDISDVMVAAGRLRAEREGTPAHFICADAQTYAFEPASFDTIISRFGVMFFDDAVQAFGNLRRAAREGAGLRLIVPRSAEENSFMTTAERAAAPYLPSLPERRPDAPGQFAFADRRRIFDILQESRWADIEIQPIDAGCTFPEADLVRFFTRLGPLGRVLHEADDPTRARVIEAVRTAFDPYVHGAEVRFAGACWLVGARAEVGAV